jgi:rhodanese-related sulfurtransferase
MNIINREELKVKLDRGDDVKLVMALDRRAYENMRIPGSLHFANILETMNSLHPDDEIVVYCSNPACPASINLYRTLVRRGFRYVYRYAGGLAEWQEAGYLLEGLMVQSAGQHIDLAAPSLSMVAG